MLSTSRKDIRRAEKRADLHLTQDRETVIAICQTEAGRRWLFERMSESHIFTTTFNTDPTQAAFNEGNRNAGLKLLNQIMSFCPEHFIDMMRENNVRRSTSESGSDNDSGGNPTVDDPDTVPDGPNDY